MSTIRSFQASPSAAQVGGKRNKAAKALNGGVWRQEPSLSNAGLRCFRQEMSSGYMLETGLNRCAESSDALDGDDAVAGAADRASQCFNNKRNLPLCRRLVDSCRMGRAVRWFADFRNYLLNRRSIWQNRLLHRPILSDAWPSAEAHRWLNRAGQQIPPRSGKDSISLIDPAPRTEQGT